MLQAIRRKYPRCRIDFWGSELTKDFEEKLQNAENQNIIDWRISWDSNIENKFLYLAKNASKRGRPDWLINCDGYNPVTRVIGGWLNPKWVSGACLDVTGKKNIKLGDNPRNKFLDDNDWDSAEFKKRYNGLFKSQYLGELLCQMSFIEPTESDLYNINLPTEKPSFEIPEILIHCTSTREAKMWSYEGWVEVIQWCLDSQKSIGMVGASPKQQEEEYNSGNLEIQLLNHFNNRDTGKIQIRDLRGKTSLLSLAGACKGAKLLVTVDAGPMHVAAATDCQVIVIVGNDNDGEGASPIRLWLPKKENIKRTVSTNKCKSCQMNRYKNSQCIENSQICMQGVSSVQVIELIENVFNESRV